MYQWARIHHSPTLASPNGEVEAVVNDPRAVALVEIIDDRQGEAAMRALVGHHVLPGSVLGGGPQGAKNYSNDNSPSLVTWTFKPKMPSSEVERIGTR